MGRCESYKLVNLILKGFLASPLIAAGICGNLAAFIVFSSRRHKNTVLIFLRSLAIADSLYLAGYFATFSWYQFYYFYDHAEKVRHIVIPIWVYVFPLAIMARTTSVWLTVAIAAQRWIAVTFPLKVSVWAISCFSHNESIGSILVNEAAFKPTNLINVKSICSRKRVLVVLVSIVMTAVAMNLASFFESYISYKNETDSVTNVTKSVIHRSYRAFTQWHSYKLYYKLVFCMTLNTFLPVLLCSGFTIQLLKALVTARKERETLMQRDLRLIENKMTLAYDELTLTLTILVIVFLLTQLPMTVYAIYRLYLTAEQQRDCQRSAFHYLTSIADTLTVVNSSVNFLIYYPSAVTFRRTMQQMFSRISFTSSGKSSNNRQNYAAVQQIPVEQ